MEDFDVFMHRKILLSKVLAGAWEEAISLCDKFPGLIAAKITETGNTILHVAVQAGQETVVQKLLESVGRYETTAPMNVENERGNTPLHLAVVMGSVPMSRLFAEKDPQLIGFRNKDAETPFFLAVLHGWKDVFLCLHSICGSEQGYAFSRRRDGRTILHSAITGEYLDLAYLILHLYPFLVHIVNEQSFSPMHILATKPSLFRSGSQVRRFDRIIYYSDGSMAAKRKARQSYPTKFFTNAVLWVLGSRKIKERKQKHVWCNQVLNKLLEGAMSYDYRDFGWAPPHITLDEITDGLDQASPQGSNSEATTEGETMRMLEMKKLNPIMMAAKAGIVEMVDKTLEHFPASIEDKTFDNKNILLVAVEKRQPQVFQLLLDKIYTMKDNMFRKIDKDGNSALHLAAKLGEHKPWVNQDAALHMQREIKWYQFVKESMPVGSGVRYNHDGYTPEELFVETHREVVKVAAEWLTHTSESCSFVAALVATVAFATATTIPGGVKQDIGTPALKDEPAFYVFAISSLVALCFSVTSTVIFLAILTFGFQIKEFHTSLPRKLLAGLATLCVSIIAMMFSFCASHFFILKDKLSYGAFGLYAAMALMPVVMTFFLISKFPHSTDLMFATFTNRPLAIPPPDRSDEMILP